MTDTRKEFEEWKTKRDIETNNSPIMPFEIWQACQKLNDKRIQQLLALVEKKNEALREANELFSLMYGINEKAPQSVFNVSEALALSAEDVVSTLDDGEKLYKIQMKVINGALCFRQAPDGRWKEVNSIKGIALFSMSCKHCGSKDARCQCWNDE